MKAAVRIALAVERPMRRRNWSWGLLSAFALALFCICVTGWVQIVILEPQVDRFMLLGDHPRWAPVVWIAAEIFWIWHFSRPEQE